MKKFLSVFLAVVLVFALASVASAADYVSEETTFTIQKDFEVTGGKVIPSEELEFDVEADGSNPSDTMLTVENLTPEAITGNEITINVPSYDKVGLYHYTITEKAGDAQGVEYSDEEILISVLVTYNYDDGALDVEVGVTQPDEGDKLDVITNTYGVGTLTVSKEVKGNLGDKSKLFNVKVTLTAENKVYSDIGVAGGSDSGNVQTITGDGWSGEKIVNLKLASSDEVTFSDIPAGVTYVVEEDSSHLAAGEKPTLEELNGEEGYLVEYTDEEGEIEADKTAAASIVNTKETEIDNGIVLDSLPYIVIGVLVLGAAAFMIIRKRRIED